MNSPWDHFGLHQGRKCQNDHGVRGPQKTYFKAYIIHWRGPMRFAVEKAKEMLSKKKTHGIEMML